MTITPTAPRRQQAPIRITPPGDADATAPPPVDTGATVAPPPVDANSTVLSGFDFDSDSSCLPPRRLEELQQGRTSLDPPLHFHIRWLMEPVVYTLSSSSSDGRGQQEGLKSPEQQAIQESIQEVLTTHLQAQS